MAEYRPGALAAESKKKGYKPGALAAESKSKRREVSKPDAGLSPWERFVTTLDTAVRNISPIPDMLDEAREIGSGIARGLTNLTAPGGPKQPVLESFAPKPGPAEPMRVFRQRTNEKSGTPAKVGAFIGDLGLAVATDPMNPAFNAGGALLGQGFKVGTTAFKATKAGQKVEQVRQRVVDPIKNSRLGAEGQRFLLWLGTGPYQRMFKETLKDYGNEVGYQVQRVANVADDIARETRKAQGTSRMFRDNMESYAAQTGSHPVITLVRKAVRDGGTAGVPLAGMNPKQRAAILNKYANSYGVSPEFILNKADEILTHIDETEKLLYKSGVKPTVNKGGATNRLIEPEDWMNQMFGEQRPVPKTIAQALAGKTEGGKANIQQIHEAGVRNLINDLPKHSEWVRPVTGPVPQGWTIVEPGGILGSKLGGYMMPAPLYNALEVEMSRAGKVVSNQIKSEYIIAFDVAQWYQKNIAGTVKKGLIGNPATQAANLVGNQYMMGKALARGGVQADVVQQGAALKEAFKEVIAMRQGVRSKGVDRLSRHSPSLLTTQIESSIADPAGTLGQLDKVRYIPGTNRSFTVAKPGGLTGRALGEGKLGETAATAGAVANKLNPANAFAEFQGIAEQAYKLATFKILAKKLGDREAAALTEKYLFDYTDRGVLLEVADRFGVWTFNAFPTKALGVFIDELVQNPAKLAKYSRVRELGLAGQDTAGLEQVNERYKTPATFPIDDQGTVLDLQRFSPFGAVLEGVSDVAEGKLNPLQALPSMVGLGRAGENPIEAVLNAGLFGRARDIGRGVSPYSEESEVRPLLSEGQPQNELAGKQRAELARNYLPSLVGGRGTQDLTAAAKGVTRSDYADQASRDVESVLLQHGLGLRTFTALTEEKRGEKFAGDREKRAGVVEPVWDKLYTMAEKAIKNPHTQDAAKMTPRQAAAKAGKTLNYVRNLHQSPAVVDREFRLTAEGKKRLQNAALLLVALTKRAEEE